VPKPLADFILNGSENAVGRLYPFAFSFCSDIATGRSRAWRWIFQ
jgi:hypothetical protein